METTQALPVDALFRATPLAKLGTGVDGLDEVLDGGFYSGRFTWSALKQTLRIPSAWLVYLLDGCQGSTWWAFSFWAPAYLVRRQIAPNSDVAALALLPAILGFVTGTVLGGWFIDRLRRRTELSAVWVALLSTSGALVLSVVVFSLTSLTAVLVAGFFLGLFGYLIMPAINVILYDVVPPETRSSATAADGVVMSTISALTGLAIGAVSEYVGAQQGLAEGNLRVGFQGLPGDAHQVSALLGGNEAGFVGAGGHLLQGDADRFAAGGDDIGL